MWHRMGHRKDTLMIGAEMREQNVPCSTPAGPGASSTVVGMLWQLVGAQKLATGITGRELCRCVKY